MSSFVLKTFCMRTSKIFVTVDAVILRKSADYELLLIKRKNEPFKDCWALPGGFVDENEDLKAAAIRELEEVGEKHLGELLTAPAERAFWWPRFQRLARWFVAEENKRRASGLRFDEALPGWHMYGTDIVQTARAAGQGAYAGALPCIHNDRYHGALGADFDEAYRFMQRKWAGALPLRTPITKISRSGLHLMRDHWRNRRSAGVREGMALGTDHPVEDLAARCGWSHLGP